MERVIEEEEFKRTITKSKIEVEVRVDCIAVLIRKLESNQRPPADGTNSDEI